MPTVATAFAGGMSGFTPQSARNAEEFQPIKGLLSGRTNVRRIRSEDIGPLIHATRVAGVRISELAVRRIAACQPDALWSFVRNERLVGWLGMLMLNEAGLTALLADVVDFHDPDASLLVEPAAAPAAIYIWGIIAAALAIDGIAEVMLRLSCPKYDSADIYAFQTTPAGARLQRKLGFEPVPGHPRHLFRYVRVANRLQ